MDGRFYIVDTARVFPPTTPIKGIRGCYLYKLLRKELVHSNPKALSSDAFSFFGKAGGEVDLAYVTWRLQPLPNPARYEKLAPAFSKNPSPN